MPLGIAPPAVPGPRVVDIKITGFETIVHVVDLVVAPAAPAALPDRRNMSVPDVRVRAHAAGAGH